jgi:hypothetical protein
MTAQQLKSSTKRKDEAVPMEIDAGQIKDLKREAKLTRLQKEGRCFKCNKQGHLKRNCPKWAKGPDKPLPYASKACSTNAPTPVEETEEKVDPKMKELARSMLLLTSNQKDEFFDLLLEGKEDF